jgi:hypothetical protein
MDLENAPGVMQMELIGMQCDSELEKKYKDVALPGF